VKHEVFNVACGADTSVNELVDMINKFAGKSVKANYLPIRKGDVFRSWADTGKIKTLLHFNPEFTFEQGLKMTFEWFKNKK